MENYDVAIIGGGPAGYKAAEIIGAEGKKVCLIEKNAAHLGGTCLNEGCIPVKSWVEAAHHYKIIQQGPFAETESKNISPDLKKIKAFSEKNINTLKNGLLSLLKIKKVEIIYGTALFKDAKNIEITKANQEKMIITAQQIIIASGSEARMVPGILTDHETVLDSWSLLENTGKINELLIIGGGVIGCEFALIYNQLGTKVTVVEIASQLLPGEDAEISRTLQREFKKQGIEVLLEHKVSSVELSEKQALIQIENMQSPDEKVQLGADKVLLAVGRSPNTKNLGLDKAGIKTEKGFICVNENYQTTVSDIYAIGDVINTPMLAHAAYREAEIAADRILNKKELALYNYLYIPRIVFSSPQVGAAGLTEEQVRNQGIEAQVYKKFFKANGKAVISTEDTGFVKIIASKNDRKILGAGIIGNSATELIHILIVAMENNLTVDDLKKSVFGHPTLSEIFTDALHA